MYYKALYCITSKQFGFMLIMPTVHLNLLAYQMKVIKTLENDQTKLSIQQSNKPLAQVHSEKCRTSYFKTITHMKLPYLPIL